METVPSIVQSMEGDTLAEIFVRFNESLDRALLISHIGVIIIDERLARKGLQIVLDTLQRTRYIRDDVLVLIAEDVHASQILKVLYPRGIHASSKIASQVKNYNKSWGGIPESSLFDVSEALLAEGRELMLGSITMKGSLKDANKLDSIKSLTPKASIVIAGSGVFSEDKLFGFISVEDSRMVLMARNQLSGTTLSVPFDEHVAAIRLNHVRSNSQVSTDKGRVNIVITIEGDGLIVGMDDSINITKVTGYEQLEQLGSGYLEQQMSASIERMQKRFGMDVFGFGEQMYRKHYAQYVPLSGNWNEIFANTPVTVKAKIKLRRSELKTNQIVNEGVGP